MPASVTTRSFDAARSGANIDETVLTPAAVKARGLKQAFVFHTPDDPRLEAQPLYLPGLKIDGKSRNVVFQATMGNWIYAWDTDDGELIWKTLLAPPIIVKTANFTDKNGQLQNRVDSMWINILWGVLSTPVIDRDRGRLYVCYWSSPDGDWAKAEFFVASVDVTTGKIDPNPIRLEGAEFAPGDGLPVIKFSSDGRKQRSALSLLNGAVLIPFGTLAEDDKQAHGWLIAIDIKSWSIAATWCSTAHKSGGGIWMSAAGPAIQKEGSIWLVTGNGEFDGKHDFGESVVRLSYTPPANGHRGTLAVTGWFTPWKDDDRDGKNVDSEAVRALLPEHMPTNFRLDHHLANNGFRGVDAAWRDQDLGSSGVVLIEELNIGLISGKDGILYTVPLDHPGNTPAGDLSPAHSPANYAKLAAPPIFYTYFDPAQHPAPGDPSFLNTYFGNRTHHLHGTPIAWKTASRGWMHFCGGENGNLRAWKIEPNLSSTYLACSEAWASPEALATPGTQGLHGGMPGWSINLSANGNADGVVWAMIPYGDANRTATNSRLLAYDAENFGRFQGGAGEIVPLWDSQAWNWNILHPKFNRPVAVDGKVLVPTYGGELLVLTLA